MSCVRVSFVRFVESTKNEKRAIVSTRSRRARERSVSFLAPLHAYLPLPLLMYNSLVLIWLADSTNRNSLSLVDAECVFVVVVVVL